jgi:hypothetical protein
LPRTFTIASSRSIAGTGVGQVHHALHLHQALELMADLLDHHRVPEVQIVMRERCFSCSVSETVRLSML